MSVPIVEQVLASVESLLQSVAEFNGGRVFTVVSEADLMDKIDAIPIPAMGVLYEGMRPVNTGVSSHKTGLSAEISISLILVTAPSFPSEPDNLTPIRILDRVRNLFKDTRSPTGHFWRFVIEAPAVERESTVIWIQRWSTPVQLHSTT